MKQTLVEICNTEWRIREASPRTLKQKYGHMREKDELEGFTDFDKQIIYVNCELHPNRKGLVVAHEMLHVYADRSGDCDMGSQEEYIRKLEHGVYEMIHKFPEEYKNGLQNDS